MKLQYAAAATLACIALPGAARAARPKPARCAITSADSPAYRGPCLFLAEEGGSFTLQPSGRRAFFAEITNLSVYITEPGIAQVSGLTKLGINSRWGEARRSRKHRACWDGADFHICVY